MLSVPERSRWPYAAAAIAVVLLLAGGAAIVWLNARVVLAEQFMEERQWGKARRALATYLQLKPYDVQARLLMARCLISDNSLPTPENVQGALQHLGKIPGESPSSAEARVQEGRLHLLLLLQPGRAERCFLRALQREPHRADAHSLLWKLYDLTGRWHLAAPHFWEVYDQTVASDRSVLLRDWYLSEFSPATATADLDRRLGIIGEVEHPGLDSERRRLETFIAAESDWPVGHAVLARWCQRHEMRSRVKALLARAKSLEGGGQDPFVLATQVFVSVELGEFDEARAALANWPPPYEGYEYWKCRGLVADEILRDDHQARGAYQRALDTIPGQSDWLIRHSLAQCLARLGDQQSAANARRRSKEIELLMESDVHGPLRKALVHPNNSQTIGRMVDFYEKLGRPREKQAWQNLVPPSSRLEQHSSAQAVVSPSTPDRSLQRFQVLPQYATKITAVIEACASSFARSH
jgi:tetratricopeptide (TPR) repeat protein